MLPSCGLSIALTRDFGSVEAWRSQFMGLAKAMGGGSGWALLSWSSRESRLINHWATDHTHLLAGASPVLALDMYEHAYHMDFGAKAGAYVDAFMANIQWDKVYKRYGAAVEADALAFGIDTGGALAGAPGALDMYEHAYHMDFGAKAGAYVDAFMANIQWDKVYKRYGAAVEADALAFGIDTGGALAGAPGALDVRREEDYVQSPQVIAGASWRDPSRVHEWSQELDASKPVLLYCLRGKDIGRSTVLALRARGMDARYIVGGIEAWQAAGLPLQTPGGAA